MIAVADVLLVSLWRPSLALGSLLTHRHAIITFLCSIMIVLSIFALLSLLGDAFAYSCGAVAEGTACTCVLTSSDAASPTWFVPFLFILDLLLFD